MSAPREGFVISLEEWVDIVALHRQGLSIKAIARKLGISRNAVQRALRCDGPPTRAPQRRPPSKIEPFKDYLLARLAEFPELSTVVLFEEIQALGYTGGLTILRNFTRPYRVRRREPVVRFETPPGHQAQVDWAHLGIHVLDGIQTPLHLFVMVLGFSRALYAEVVTSIDIQTFLRLHVRAFESFGGIPEEILYDNQKQVVLSRTVDGPRFHPEFLSFSGQFGFKARLCRPYRARTKGKVDDSDPSMRDVLATSSHTSSWSAKKHCARKCCASTSNPIGCPSASCRSASAIECSRTFRSLAERAGISYSYITEIENGNKPPSSSVLGPIATALGLRMSQLIEAAEGRMETQGSEWKLNSPMAKPAPCALPADQAQVPFSGYSSMRPSLRGPNRDRRTAVLELERLVQDMAPEDIERLLDYARRLTR
jgi:transposase